MPYFSQSSLIFPKTTEYPTVSRKGLLEGGGGEAEFKSLELESASLVTQTGKSQLPIDQ